MILIIPAYFLVNFILWLLETSCDSHGGQKYVKCPNSDRCFPEISFVEASDCVDSNHQTTECRTDDQHEGWRCESGQCIRKELVCNNKADCTDKSDETLGCNLFPETNCKSWFGLKYVNCAIEGTLPTLS